MKIIDDERLDSIGFEEESNTVLDVWLENQKLKQDGIPLTGLIGKLKEVSGLMPILKKVYSKQIEMEMDVHRFMAACEDNFLYKEQLDVDFGSNQKEIMAMVKERLDEHLKIVEERIMICPTDASVIERLKQKASTNEYGGLCKSIAELRGNLAPLIDKGYVLKRFIN